MKLSNFSSKISQNRDYGFNANSLSKINVMKNCEKFFKDYGFCLLDNLVPTNKIKSLIEEIINAQKKSFLNIKNIKETLKKNKISEKKLLNNKNLFLRSVGKEGRPSKPVNDIVWMPKYAKYLSNSNLIKLIKNLLDDHIRIVQLHSKIIQPNNFKNLSEVEIGNDNLGLPRLYKGPKNARDWHTDWPHDLSAYGGGNANENIGFIRQPFPDVTMCIVVIFYLNDVDENSGGTWLVPGSHKDKRNPRGPKDKIVLTAPVPGEMQVKAKAGSVFIQDSRLWHSSPFHNLSNNSRVAVVSRWCPWWLSADEFAPRSRFNITCRPISKSEFYSLPKKLKPLMKHLCSKEQNTIEKTVLKKSEAASKKTRWAHKLLKRNKVNLKEANKNIIVNLKS